MKKKPTLHDYITPVYKIECHFCGARDVLGWEDEVFSAVSAKRTLHKDGWIVMPSLRGFTYSVACPACAKKKDKDR